MADAIPSDVLDRMAGAFRLLADPSRLAILSCLLKGGERSVGEVAELTSRTSANVSKHLKLLAEGGILARRKEGLQVFYRLDDPTWEQVCRLVSGTLLTDWGDTPSPGGPPPGPNAPGAEAAGF